MRKQIAAANWKMNLTYQEAENLLEAIIKQDTKLSHNREVVFAVPAPYLDMAESKIANQAHMYVASQNVFSKTSGAYTGEISVAMLQSMCIEYAIVGHSERREYFHESNHLLADKVKTCLDNKITPIFCCGEALEVREANGQNEFVGKQLEESLYQLSTDEIQKVVIAYEPIWAIGTGKTASSDQAQEMHSFIRSQLATKFGSDVANNVSILYGGSVKAANAKEIFGKPDVDGGLVGGASLVVDEFVAIIKALK
ncbi:MAG TPA: triose-phosphate isomerase [Segetibacter sp.]|jgi:triosephosphate isomerase